MYYYLGINRPIVFENLPKILSLDIHVLGNAEHNRQNPNECLF